MMKFRFICLQWTLMCLKIIGVDCCAGLDTFDVENGFMSCRTNASCEAQCYPGYIFPTGNTKNNYSCLQDSPGMVSSCKRIPVVMIEYKASWNINNAPPKACDNISTLLSQSKDMVEERLILCNTSAVDVNITFKYETLAFTVVLIFTGEYYNFTSTADLNKCVSLHLDYFKNDTSHFITSHFDDVICFNEIINHTLRTDWHISDRQEHCPAGTEVKNVTATQSNENNIDYYCDRPSISTDSILEIASQNFTTVVNSTSLYSGSTIETIEYTFERRTLYYGIAAVIGILLLLTLITILAASCKTTSFKTLKEQVQGNEMTELEMSFGTPFKGILIENEFYQSADDEALVSKDDVPIVRKDTGEYSTAVPYSIVDISELESEEKNYSYATPLNQENETVSNDVIDEETNLQANRNRFSDAKVTANPPIVESSRVVLKKESKEEQNSLEAALSVLDEWIEENKVTRNSCQYTLVDKTFNSA